MGLNDKIILKYLVNYIYIMDDTIRLVRIYMENPKHSGLVSHTAGSETEVSNQIC